ncbi:MAG: hybrid sensor histidine kinase/response regulator [Cyanobacteria bacterium CRU_2_1]|nr:hybrid sensor histidine kinase/response regulator [Cyanobacteria bacterium CRU_2_1]
MMIEDEELRNLYKISCKERLQKLEAGLLQLAEHPGDEAPLELLQREIHSLKGDSRSVELDTVATLAQHIENILKSLQRREMTLTAEVNDRLYQGLNAIGQLVHEAVTGEPSRVDVAQVNELMTAVCEDSHPDTVVPQFASSDIEDKELQEIFKATSEERLQKLEAGLVHLEMYPDDIAVLAELMREAHSLKGDSRSAGIDTIEILTHQIEDILGRIQRREVLLTSELSDRLYQGLDTINLLVQEAVTGKPRGIQVEQALNRLIEVIPTAIGSEWQPEVSVSLETLTQDLPSLAPKVDEPYHIDTIRIQTRDLDTLMAQAEELTVTRIQITQAFTQAEQIAVLWEEWKVNRSREQYSRVASVSTNPYEESLEKLIKDLRTSAQENSIKLDLIAEALREKVYALRLLPLSTLFQKFSRTVRDLAKQQSKAVELVIEGGETTADKRILEGIKDSLMHLIRNAIDHGIETPTERESLGKSPVAKIWLKAYQIATSIVIEVVDNGRGLDIEQIKQTAIRRKLHSPKELEIMPPSQICALVLAPGFSTRTFITEISGRGVGLDVVRTNVERLKGNIQIESTPGQGCTFRLQLSTSLTTMNIILIEVQGIVHALPFEFLQTTLLISADQIITTEDRDTILLNDQPVPVINLIDVLELSNSLAYPCVAKFKRHSSERRPCLIFGLGEEKAGFFVDRLLETQEVVIKPQSRLLKRVRNVLGATTLSTGEVCIILNPLDLIKSLQKSSAAVASIRPSESAQRKPVILLVEDSMPVLTQEKRLFESAGYEVVAAIDGLEGYNKLRTRTFDAVVSDVEMPNLDGLSLTARIRQHPEYDELPIILVTTLSSDDDRKRGAEAGANAYITKGKFNQEVLLETLARLV